MLAQQTKIYTATKMLNGKVTQLKNVKWQSLNQG